MRIVEFQKYTLCLHEVEYVKSWSWFTDFAVERNVYEQSIDMLANIS